MQLTTAATKTCPFCAETILAAAIKCRYCGEFLNTPRARALQARATEPSAEPPGQEQDQQDANILFAAQPSLWAMTGAVVKGAIVLAFAVLLMSYQVERFSFLRLSAEGAAIVGKYRFLFGLGIAIAVAVTLILKAVRLKMTYYEISADRIEHSEGLLDRQVDNIDMFRIIDLKLRRNFLDIITGVGTVTVVTTDKSDPEFVFQKVQQPRALYDAIKKASLDADRRTGVVHLE